MKSNFILLLALIFILSRRKDESIKNVLSSISVDDALSVLKYFGLDESVLNAAVEILPELMSGKTDFSSSYTYLLGLFMRCTQNIASVPIRHFEREVGESGYTLGQLIRLWSSVLGFSVIPLRMASIAGFFFAGVGFIMAIVVFLMKFMRPDMSMGWPSLMCAITFFFGSL